MTEINQCLSEMSVRIFETIFFVNVDKYDCEYVFVTKKPFKRIVYQKMFLILPCFFDENCCYKLYTTKTTHTVKKCFRLTKLFKNE